MGQNDLFLFYAKNHIIFHEDIWCLDLFKSPFCCSPCTGLYMRRAVSPRWRICPLSLDRRACGREDREVMWPADTAEDNRHRNCQHTWTNTLEMLSPEPKHKNKSKDMQAFHCRSDHFVTFQRFFQCLNKIRPEQNTGYVRFSHFLLKSQVRRYSFDKAFSGWRTEHKRWCIGPSGRAQFILLAWLSTESQYTDTSRKKRAVKLQWQICHLSDGWGGTLKDRRSDESLRVSPPD